MLPLLIGLTAAVVVLGFLAGPALERLQPWAVRPGVVVTCWSGALLGTFVALVGMSVIALVLPPTPGHGLLEWLQDCLPHHGGTAVAVAGMGSLVVGGLWWTRLARGIPRVRRTLRRRRAHRETLRLVAREDRRHPDVLLLDHPLPVAYCLPSRWRPIVLSTGAQEHLTDSQLEAVLAHERAHLRQHHHLLLLLLDLAFALMPWLPTVRGAHRTLPLLLEMSADDAAARAWGGPALAGALRRVATAPQPAGALAAAGSGEKALPRRLERLEAEVSRPVRGGRQLAWLFAASAAFLPLATVLMVIPKIPGLC